MSTLSLFRSLIIVTITAVIPVIVFADENLTPEQLVLLMRASCEQYETIDAKMIAISYQYDVDKNAEPKVKLTREIISRWTRTKSFSRTIKTSYPDTIPHEDYTPTTISTYVITPKCSKRLIEASDNRIPRGLVMSGVTLEQDQAFYTIYMALWDFFGWPWEEMNLDKATISHDETNNYYVMKVQMSSSSKGPFVTLYIDPSKDYIPIKKEFLKNDGTLILISECDDFQQVANGLWIPYKYSCLDPRINYGEVYEVEEVIVNQPIADNLLDFAFPSGTIVSDEIRNVKYRIGEEPQFQDTIAEPYSGITTDIPVTSPAKEEDLLASAQKAKELLKAHSVKTIELPVIEVWPTTVMVAPNKHEYKLSVKKHDGTKPALLNHGFEGSGLELLSFKNCVDDEDQLVVNINRLLSHTGFASSTLLLHFSGEDGPTRVTFVSAPLENR